MVGPQAVPDVTVRLERYVSKGAYSIGREWIGLLKQRIIRAHEQYTRNLWEQHYGS